MTSEFEDSAYARAAMQRALKTQKTRRRWQQLAGVVLLLLGYACLAVPAGWGWDWLQAQSPSGVRLRRIGGECW